MKKSWNIISMIIFCYSILGMVHGQNITLKPYGLESGIIDYKFSGAQEGVGTLYFDKYGRRTNMYLDAVEGGKHQKGYTLTIGEDQYMYDPGKPKDGVKMKNPIYKDLDDNATIETILAKVYGKMGLNKTGKSTFLGKECEVWTGDEGEALIWKGILLKLDLDIFNNKIQQEATAIKENVPVDPSLLEVPEGIDFIEMPGFNF
jgi:hypothetical protein